LAIGPSGRNPSGSPQVSFRLSKASGSVKSGRALANRPRVILGDEPTGNLDTQNSMNIFDIFHELNEQNGQTLVIVTHDPDLAGRCLRQVKLRDGKTVEDSEQKCEIDNG